MTKKNKLTQKFKNSPKSITYNELQTILQWLGFKKIRAKGSHTKWKHPSTNADLIIPVHSNECKEYYKKQALKFIKKNKLLDNFYNP